MKYKSDLIKEIVETRGHNLSSPHYESECVKSWIEETKEAYPKLCDYESEWLNYIIEKTIGNVSYETVIVNPTTTINNVVPYEYKSAILKGKTDENLQSVKMPVLTTTGKNLFDKTKTIFDRLLDCKTGIISHDSETNITDFIKVIPNTQYTMSFDFETSAWTRCVGFTEPKHDKYATDVNGISDRCYFDSDSKTITFTTSPTTKYLLFSFGKGVEESFQIEQGSTATSYEPYKSNILTVNEDITLRSNGDVYDELNLLTGRLTQRIDENNEVLAQEVVKTIALTPLNKPYKGTNHYHLIANIPCEAILEVPVVSTGKQTIEEINN